MTLYAQTVIEEPGAGGARYAPGDRVPADLAGVDQLKESGAVGTSKPDPSELEPRTDAATGVEAANLEKSEEG